MFKKDDSIYFVDIDNEKVVQGLVDSNDNGLSKKILIKFDGNDILKIYIDRKLISKTEADAKIQFEVWKEDYKNSLIQDDKWIIELFESWVAHECEYEAKACQSVMKEIISDKLKVNV